MEAIRWGWGGDNGALAALPFALPHSRLAQSRQMESSKQLSNLEIPSSAVFCRGGEVG